MKKLTILILFFFSSITFGQEADVDYDGGGGSDWGSSRFQERVSVSKAYLVKYFQAIDMDAVFNRPAITWYLRDAFQDNYEVLRQILIYEASNLNIIYNDNACSSTINDADHSDDDHTWICTGDKSISPVFINIPAFRRTYLPEYSDGPAPNGIPYLPSPHHLIKVLIHEILHHIQESYIPDYQSLKKLDPGHIETVVSDDAEALAFQVYREAYSALYGIAEGNFVEKDRRLCFRNGTIKIDPEKGRIKVRLNSEDVAKETANCLRDKLTQGKDDGPAKMKYEFQCVADNVRPCELIDEKYNSIRVQALVAFGSIHIRVSQPRPTGKENLFYLKTGGQPVPDTNGRDYLMHYLRRD